MSASEQIDALDDRTVMLVLGHLTERLTGSVPLASTTSVQSEEEARGAIVASWSAIASEGEHLVASDVVPEGVDGPELGRRILKQLVADPSVQPLVAELLADPPRDEQMSVEMAAAAAVILGLTIAWLQTQVTIQVQRKGGQTEFDVTVKKSAADLSLIKKVVEAVTNVIPLV